ncbi:hypothetical protein DRW42_23905 [Pedobacter miscanthi]|uniref:Type II toxin-antitoxin system RelE/ParE family toxin n=1 Tax=Pedobacter miscanthi TaxID=2259170 RepID=A0A366KMU1_9SPHI|nr:hypothetical protein DRW42_23905 [Pedobacter miscanthi]
MEAVVNFQPLVLLYFNHLINDLFYEGYFSYKESALKYVSKIIYNVENTIHLKKHYPCSNSLLKHGSYYIHFNMNPNTTWYFVFEKNDNRYLITYVFNNYSPEAKDLIYDF